MSRLWSRRAILAGAAVCGSLPALSFLGARGAAQDKDSLRSSEIRFRDLTGEQIALPAPAQRIIGIWTSGTAFAIAAHGSPSRLIAVDYRTHMNFKHGLVGRYYPEVLDLPHDILMGNGAPNIERLVNLNPDIVVTFKQDARDSSVAMRNAGLRVARYAKVDGSIRRTIAAFLLMYGQMIGDTARAERIVSIMEEATARLNAVQSVPESDRPSVLLLMPNGGRLYASGGGADSLYADYIYAAGGINAAAALPGVVQTSAEQVAAWNPDVILIFPTYGASPETIYNHPVLGSGRAASERRVYVLPTGTNNWGSLCPEAFLAPIWLAELLYPNLLKSTLREDMLRTYGAIFDRTPAEDELDEVLRVDLNGAAAGYARLLRRASASSRDGTSAPGEHR